MNPSSFSLSTTPNPSSDTHRIPPLVFGFVVFLLIIIFGILIYFSILRQFATIDLLYAPTSASVTIDGKPYASGKIRLSAGSHELTIEKYGFTPVSTSLELPANQTTPAYYVLTPSEEFTADWYSSHPDDELLVEGITSYQFDNSAQAAQTSYPSLSKLPITTTNYSIYRSTCSDSDTYNCVYIDSEPQYRDAALIYFRDHIDSALGRYRFSFKNYYNLFKGEG